MGRNLGRLLGLCWFYVIPIRRRTVLENLSRAFPEKSASERWKMARKNYVHYGLNFCELLCSFTWSKTDFSKRVALTGEKQLLDYLQTHSRGAYLLSLHLGNWELSSGRVIAAGVPLDAVVKTARSAVVQELLEYQRSVLGMGVHYESGTARAILNAVSREKRMVGFFLDQFMGPPIGLPVKFFGQTAGTAAALSLMTEKHNDPVFPVYTYRDRSHKIHVMIEKPVEYPPLSEDKAERLHQKTQVYNDTMERLVRLYPEQWLWLHRRWKPYVGVPRWKPALAAFLCWLMTACVSPDGNRTGIVLPPEPEVSVPNFKDVETVKVTEMETVEPVEAKTPKKKLKKSSKSKENQEAKPVRVFAFDDLPFEIGEQLVLQLSWTMLPAGTAILEVGSGEMVAGRPTIKLSGRVLSSRIVDAIYHVDNRVETLVDREALIPYRFVLSMLETHQNKETRVKFDHVRKVAHYQADRKSQKWGNQVDDRKDSIQPFSQDMFSAVYYARTLKYEMGRTEHFPIYENGKNLEVGLTPIGREVVTTGVGAFQCWKLKLSLRINNVLSPTGDVFLWLSDDHKKYVVKFEAAIKIGSLNGLLTEIRERK